MTIQETDKTQVKTAAGAEQAFLITQMTTAEREALTPQEGMIIYDTGDNKYYGYNNNGWEVLDNVPGTVYKGTATLVNGVATVTNSNIKADSTVFVSIKTPLGVPGAVYVGMIMVDTYFEIHSTSSADNSTVNWSF